MGLMDKMKEQAAQALNKAQQGVSQGKAKIDEAQAKHQWDGLLRNLGAAVYAEQREGGSSDAVTAALAALDAQAARVRDEGGDGSPDDLGNWTSPHEGDDVANWPGERARSRADPCLFKVRAPELCPPTLCPPTLCPLKLCPLKLCPPKLCLAVLRGTTRRPPRAEVARRRPATSGLFPRERVAWSPWAWPSGIWSVADLTLYYYTS